MHSKIAWFLTLAAFSGLSMNLILRFGIGLQRIAEEEDPRGAGANGKWVLLIRFGLNFISVMLLWLFFSLLQSWIFSGFLEYIMIFPVCFLFFTVIECLAKRMVLKTGWRGGIVSSYLTSESGGAAVKGAVTGTALFIILGLAGGIAEAAALSFGFFAGAALAVLIVGEIRRRSEMEAVPRRFRGGPLVLITLGLLSLVCASAAVVFYAVLGAN